MGTVSAYLKGYVVFVCVWESQLTKVGGGQNINQYKANNVPRGGDI